MILNKSLNIVNIIHLANSRGSNEVSTECYCYDFILFKISVAVKSKNSKQSK